MARLWRVVLYAATVSVILAFWAVSAEVSVGFYGHPGSINGGVYVTKLNTCQDIGFEIWGHRGFFHDGDC